MSYPSIEISRLAEQLTANYFEVSLNMNGSSANQQKIYEDITDNTRLKEINTCRNIVVVGAGASKDCYDLDLAYEAIDKLNEKFNISFLLSDNFEGMIKKLLEKYVYDEKRVLHKPDLEHFINSFQKRYVDEKEKMKSISNLDSDQQLDFESHLALLAHFFSIRDIREELRHIYDYRYYPTMSYEILAHLFKHRFVDVIINFNFDELLDQAIAEELNDSDYHFIFSDGHCQELTDIVIDNRLKVPIYIKPHGTVSHKSSLKFTKEDYMSLPLDMHRQLEELVGGYIKSDDQSQMVKEVNLIFFGFSMKSVEFNNILKHQNSEVKFNAYFFDINHEIVGNDMVKNIFGSNKYLIPVDEKKGLKEPLSELWNEIEEKFRDPYKPRGLWRNRIIALLFHDPEKKKRTIGNDKDYFLQRVFVEIAITLCINKGRIYLSQLASDRTGHYYNLYQKQAIKDLESTRVEDALVQFVPSLHEIISEIFDLDSLDVYSRERFGMMDLQEVDPDNQAQLDKFLILVFEKISGCIDYFHEKLPNEFNIQEQVDFQELLPLVKTDFRALVKHSSYDLCPRFSDMSFNTHKHHRKDMVLNTRLALKRSLMEALNEDWDLYLMVSERGSLLKSMDIDFKRNQRCAFIVAEENYIEFLRKKYKRYFLKENNNVGVKVLPWWAHEYHMSLFLKKVNQEQHGEGLSRIGWHVNKAIYFKVENNNNSINPILIDGTNLKKIPKNKEQFKVEANPDRTFLTKLFFGYYSKAKLQSTEFGDFRPLQRTNQEFEEEFMSWLKDIREHEF